MTQPTPVVDRMDSLVQQWEQRADQRSAFLHCYALMTGNTLRAIDQSQFHDPQWVTQLLHLFADYYFQALEAYDQNDARTPVVWRLAFGAAGEQQTQILQNLLLGINAHINYDLVLTLVDMLEREWATLSPEQRQQRYEDHCHVNTIIAATVDSVQDQVVTPESRWLEVVDWVFGPLDERMAARLIRHWREHVWQLAMQMLATTDQDERADLRRLLESQSVARSQQILARRVDQMLRELL